MKNEVQPTSTWARPYGPRKKNRDTGLDDQKKLKKSLFNQVHSQNQVSTSQTLTSPALTTRYKQLEIVKQQQYRQKKRSRTQHKKISKQKKN